MSIDDLLNGINEFVPTTSEEEETHKKTSDQASKARGIYREMEVDVADLQKLDEQEANIRRRREAILKRLWLKEQKAKRLHAFAKYNLRKLSQGQTPTISEENN